MKCGRLISVIFMACVQATFAGRLQSQVTATQSALDQMISNAHKSESDKTEPVKPTMSSLEEPEFSGIFYALAGGKLTSLERQNTSVQIGVGGMFIMRGKGVMKFNGAHSPVRLQHDHSLIFVVRSSTDSDPGAHFHLRRLEVRKSGREVTVVSVHVSPLGASVKSNDRNIVSVEYARYGAHSVRITATALEPGEYAIGMQGGRTLFCFGVD